MPLRQNSQLLRKNVLCITGARIDWLIDWGLTPFSIIVQSYHGDQFTYSCVSWFSHTSTPHNIFSKQLAAFPQRLLNSPLVKDEWRMSQWLLSNVGKNVGRAGIRTHNPWIDSPRRYRLSYRGSARERQKTHWFSELAAVIKLIGEGLKSL